LLRAALFVAEYRAVQWVVEANEKGVYPWTRDLSMQLNAALGVLEK
jgi:hypothetical protein